MGCDRLYGPGRVVAIVCSRGRGRGRALPPCQCGGAASYECDGPGAAQGKTCDRPMCARCAVSIRNLDLDFCQRCAGQYPLLVECLLAGLSQAPVGSPVLSCVGVLVARVSLCVRHAVLFDHWLGLEGGHEIYARSGLSREQKREQHRRWLQLVTAERITEILGERHAA